MSDTELDEKAPENGTYGIQCDFVEKTPNGNVPFTPKSGLKYSLWDEAGQPIAGKTNVPISPVAQTVVIVLSGSDLALSGASAKRYVTVEGTYDGVLGNDLPIVREVSFKIKNIVGKP